MKKTRENASFSHSLFTKSFGEEEKRREFENTKRRRKTLAKIPSMGSRLKFQDKGHIFLGIPYNEGAWISRHIFVVLGIHSKVVCTVIIAACIGTNSM